MQGEHTYGPRDEIETRAASNAAPLHCVRRELVSVQWAYLRLIEQLAESQARRALADVLSAEASAAQALRPLTHWPSLPRATYEVYLAPPHRARVRRVLDYVQPGDRILDVGCGYGYLAGVLLRDGPIDYYCAIDIREDLIAATREMTAVNGLTDRTFALEKRNLFSVDRAFMAEHRPTLILLLEVLEHVPNPDEALCSIAGAAPQEAGILFSVPMKGRLETCWGHVSLFSVDRLQRLCQQAELTIHQVEPVYNLWAFVLASRSSLPPRKTPPLRAAALSEDPTTGPSVERFVRIRFAHSPSEYQTRWTSRARSVITVEPDGNLRCDVVGSEDTSMGQYGGVRLPIAAPHVLRLELEFLHRENIEAVYVEGGDAQGRRALRWQWLCSSSRRPTAGRTTYVLEPGKPAGQLVPYGPSLPDAVAEVHIFLRIRPTTRSGFILHRAAVASKTAPR